MWPIKEKEKTIAHIVAKSYPLWQADRIRCYGSLININPSDEVEEIERAKVVFFLPMSFVALSNFKT